MLTLKFPKLLKTKPQVLDARVAYGLWSHTYDDQPENALLFLEEKNVLPILNGLVFQSAQVIDFGCGTGRYLKHVLALSPRSVLGADFSRGMLEEARRNAKGNSESLINAEIASLPVVSECFDIGICTLVLGGVSDLHSAAAEMCRVLKPGGVLLVSEFHPDADARRWQRTFSVEMGVRGRRTFAVRNYPRPVNEYVQVFENNGMEIDLLLEPCVDESLSPFFSKAGLQTEYWKALGTPILFILKLRKR